MFIGNKYTKYIVVIVFCVTLFFNAKAEHAPLAVSVADSTKSSFSLIPEVHAAVRGRFEQSMETGAGRFQVRNARLSMEGRVAPIISYKVQVDLCDRGKIKALDAWAAIDIYKGLNIRVGQFREPFGVDCFRSPATYIFANRAALVKYVANVRGVGLQAGYLFCSLPLKLEASVFNPTEIADHDKWVKKYAYASKLTFSPTFGDSSRGNAYGKGESAARFALSFMSLRPENVRMNLWGVSAGWSNETWLIEGEYIRECYANSAARAVNAFNFFVDWGHPIKWGDFNRWSLQGRFDSMSRHSTGIVGADGRLQIDHNSRSRVTLGTTLSYKFGKIHSDIRLNYEQYFYGHGGRGREEGSRVVAELVVAF